MCRLGFWFMRDSTVSHSHWWNSDCWVVWCIIFFQSWCPLWVRVDNALEGLFQNIHRYDERYVPRLKMTGQTDKYLGPISRSALSFANCFLMQAEEIGVPIEEVLIWGRDWRPAGKCSCLFSPDFQHRSRNWIGERFYPTWISVWISQLGGQKIETLTVKTQFPQANNSSTWWSGSLCYLDTYFHMLVLVCTLI